MRRIAVPNLIHLPFLEQATVADAKLRLYVLGPTHPKGRHKAKFFEDVLGIRQEHWEYLRDEILGGLPQSRVTTIAPKHWNEDGKRHFGIEFEVPIEIHGLNGRRCAISTGWMVEGSIAPSFTTARPCR